MEIQGISAKSAVAVKPETSSQPARTDGVSFLGSVAQAVKSGKIVMPGGTQMEQTDLNKTKFVTDTGFKAEESDEEKIKGFLARIKRILEKKN